MNENTPRFYLILTVLLTSILVIATADLVFDAPEYGWSPHMAVEIAFDLLLLISITYLARGWLLARSSVSRLREKLDRRQAERDDWRQRAQQLLLGLGEAIDEQMKQWKLTDAESETALFLLKGYSHKEIANLSGKSERTVRQHSVSVYRKSGLAGRAELSAFFLEDVLLPPADHHPSPVSRSR